MRTVFGDTFYLLALYNPGDEAHERAVAMASTLRETRIVTTAWVITEFADALADSSNRRACVDFIDDLAQSPKVTVVPPSQALLEAGLQLYRDRPDKGWSLTDCISFLVMREYGITEALTGDQHFAQAGFAVLLR